MSGPSLNADHHHRHHHHHHQRHRQSSSRSSRIARTICERLRERLGRADTKSPQKMLAHPRTSTAPPAAVIVTLCTSGSSTGSGSGSGSGATTSPTPRSSSSDRRTVGSNTSSSEDAAAAARGTLADEAQACYNLLLLIRHDTQALISLRNDNLARLEEKTPSSSSSSSPPSPAAGAGAGGSDGGPNDTDRALLLAAVNEAITYATRSVAELGPFLERHRWPAAAHEQQPSEASQHHQQRRSTLAVAVKPPKILRKRRTKSGQLCTSSSSSSLSAAPAPEFRPATVAAGAAADDEGSDAAASPVSADTLFSWTLALTELHSAVLAATDRLRGFLQFGVAAVAVSDENRRRHEARASWWEQGRGEFENVELIRSLLGRPRRRWDAARQQAAAAAAGGGGGGGGATPGPGGGEPGDRGREPKEEDEPATILTPVLEVDDARSDTLASEPSSVSSTIRSTRGGLTARPRQPRREGSVGQQDAPSLVRRVVTGSLIPSSPTLGGGGGGAPQRESQMIARSETFGQAAARNTNTNTTPARAPSSRYRPSISTQPLLPSSPFSFPSSSPSPQNVLLQERLLEALAGAYQDHDHNHTPPTTPTPPPPLPAAAGTATVRSSSSPVLLKTPWPGSLHRNPSGQAATGVPARPASSPGGDAAAAAAETPHTLYTPNTPLDPQLAALIAQNALPSKTFQPVIQVLDDMMTDAPVSPVTPTDSPQKVTAPLSVPPLRSRAARESIHPVIEGTDHTFVSPVDPQEPYTAVTISSMGSQATPTQEEGGHWPYLAYMAKKQAISASRWNT